MHFRLNFLHLYDLLTWDKFIKKIREIAIKCYFVNYLKFYEIETRITQWLGDFLRLILNLKSYLNTVIARYSGSLE